MFTPSSPFALAQTAGHHVPQLVGTRKATTFRGFCARHDKTTFSPIEDQELGPSSEQLGLLAYRSLSYEVHAKRRAIIAFEALRPPRFDRLIGHERHRQDVLRAAIAGSRLALRDLAEPRKRFNTMLRDGDWRELDHLVFSTKKRCRHSW